MLALRLLPCSLIVATITPGCGATDPHLARSGEGEASAPEPALAVHPLDHEEPYRHADYAFLARYLEGRSIVQLGESIHVTAEFPRVRLHFVRFLHERLGFDVLALEGSPVDAWMAQDLVYRSADDDDLRRISERAQDAAWFGLWDTEPMRELMEYVIATQRSDAPLYLTSFDIQPGMTRAFGGDGQAAVAALIEAVARYADDPAPDRAWATAIGPLLGCFRSARPRSPQETRETNAAIDELEHWFGAMAAVIESETSQLHARALGRVPETLRQMIELCERVSRPDSPRHTYQAGRDRFNADNAVFLRDQVSRSNKVILWAHHSHVNHNSTGENIPSMGQHLLATVGADEVYTIGLFAGEGSAMAVSDDACPPVQRRPLAAADEFGVETLLRDTAETDFFIDLAGLDGEGERTKAWFAPSTARWETSMRVPTVLARDFHAAVFVREVHAVELLPAALRVALALRCGNEER